MTPAERIAARRDARDRFLRAALALSGDEPTRDEAVALALLEGAGAMRALADADHERRALALVEAHLFAARGEV